MPGGRRIFTPLVSVLVPTYRRNDLLRRNLERCAAALRGLEWRFEVVVGDNAGDPATEQLAGEYAGRGGLDVRYVGSPVTPSMQANHIRLLQAARGRWVVFVHDDDWLLTGGGKAVVRALRARPQADCMIKMGVRLASAEGMFYRWEGFRRTRWLEPREAVRLLISQSSLVRFPAVILPRERFLRQGGFREEAGYLFDIEAWTRSALESGLVVVPQTAAVFTVHAGSETNTMFTREYLERLRALLDERGALAGIAEEERERLVGRFLWRFALAGCLRAARSGQRDVLRERVVMTRDFLGGRFRCPAAWLPLWWWVRGGF